MNNQLLRLMPVLFSGMFSDELDKMGFRHQVVPGLKLNNPLLKCLGPARTVLIETLETDDENIKMGLGFLESLDRGDVLCVSGSEDYAYFGELMTRLSIRQGLSGAVIGGLTRDSAYTRSLPSFPIFAGGYSPKDIKGRGRVKSVETTIELKGVAVSPGDWIFGDHDGVVIIPAAQKESLFRRVLDVIEAEKDIVSRIDAGETISEILNFHKEF